ncbi:hypothetical protein [Desulfonema magnum]|uniref:Uncharacterized protein n=1 Tax=Desulfonema magnum TaxID=45655 RepID=A0A975BSZ4_9BACT|nr:hypothetical protein [Desulfonema magnum]QTA91111.1 Uncharacterized protein dnm_071760 [Desulfonema magnum]
MKPIYFPFTYISEPVAKALGSCFRQTVIYQPSALNHPETIQKCAETGLLDIRTPVKGNQDKLDMLIKEYRKWADLHQGGGLSFFKTRGNSIPFFDETSSSKIRSDIVRNLDSESRNINSESKKAEPDVSKLLLNIRLFLCIAQAFDMQNWELTNDLASFEKMEQELMNNLKGENSQFPIPNSQFSIPKDDPGNYMTAERTEAWVHLMQHDPEKSGLFITSSRSVFEHLADKSPDMKQVLYFDSVPLYENKKDEKLSHWQDSLMEHLDMLSETAEIPTDSIAPPPADNDCSGKVSLTFCLVPGKTPDEFFDCCVKNKIFQGEKKGGACKNTLIGIIEF